LKGELDLATVDRFRAVLQEAQLNSSTASIDLRGLSFIDCSALQAIVDADAIARLEGNRLVLVRGSGQVDRVLELIGLFERMQLAG
jgi:anti-anti-sigma factor